MGRRKGKSYGKEEEGYHSDLDGMPEVMARVKARGGVVVVVKS